MLIKVEDKYNTVSTWAAFIESMYQDWTINIKEVNDAVRLIHAVVRDRVKNNIYSIIK